MPITSVPYPIIPYSVSASNYTTTGTSYYTVPATAGGAAVSGVYVYLWGSGGSWRADGAGENSAGGGGGFVSGFYSCSPGTVLAYVVGAIGSGGSANIATGGGGGFIGAGSGGGGFSGIFLSNAGGIVQSNAIAIAGGGGGGGFDNAMPGVGYGAFKFGGFGGYPSGGTTRRSDGSTSNINLGGSQTTGGTGDGAGTALRGGISFVGGGGGGWYGGAGNGNGNGGTGGSSYIGNVNGATGGIGLTSGAYFENGTTIYQTNSFGTAMNQALAIPGGTTNQYYVAGKGVGNTSTGLVVIVPAAAVSPTGSTARVPLTVRGYGLASSYTVLSNDNVTYTVPAGVTRVRMFLWGGGAAGWGYGAGGGGGSGAHVQGDLSVTGLSTLTIYNDRGKGSGGAMSGGGYSAVYTAANGYLMIAGAGGGSSSSIGGGGGYTQGFQGGSNTTPGIQSRAANYPGGGGGSQTQGGLGGNGGGGYLQGGAGESSGYPGGGGGGYYGGAGSTQGGGGGGGSSYVNTTFITNYSGADGSNGSMSGNVLPGGSSSPYYPAGIGVGKGNAPSYDPSTTSSCVVIVPYAPPPTGITVRGSTKVAYPVFSQTFQYVGSNQAFTVPSGVSTVNVYMWGGGGGGGNGGRGGAGAFLTGQLNIPTGKTQLSVLVGGAGLFSNATTTFGAGGSGSTVSNSGSSGGGRSAIQYTVTATISSATGSAGSVTYTTNIAHGLVVGQPVIITGLTPAGYNGTFPVTVVPTTTTFRVANGTTGASSGTGTIVAELVNVGGGGGGGGSFQTIYHYAGNATFSGSANNAVGAVAGGTGGTQTAGGFTNSYGGNPAGTNGSFLTGGPGFIGNGFGGGGGGGGGYYGGGGGGGAGNGGGGSSYGSNIINLSGANTTNGSFAAPGTNITGYVAGVAVGASNQTTNGGPGLVLISYSTGSPSGITQ